VRRLIFVLLLVLLSFSVTADFGDILTSVQNGVTGLSLYDDHKEAVDVGLLFFFFVTFFWMGFQRMFKDESQRKGAKVMALVLGLSFALSAFKAGISPLSPSPFMKIFFLLFFTGGVWWMLVKVFKVESKWGRFWMLLLSGLIVFLTIAVVDSTILDDAHDFPGKEYVDKVIDWVKDAWNKIASSSPSLPTFPDPDTGGDSVPLPTEPTPTDGDGEEEKAGWMSLILIIISIIGVILFIVMSYLGRRPSGTEEPEDNPPPGIPPNTPPGTPAAEDAHEAIERAEEPVQEYEDRAKEIEKEEPKVTKETMWSPEAKANRKARAKERKKREGQGPRFKANLLGKSKPKEGFFSKFKFWEKDNDDDEPERISFSESRAHFKQLSDPVEMKRIQEFDAFEENLRRLP
jgi:hypothetical protein